MIKISKTNPTFMIFKDIKDGHFFMYNENIYLKDLFIDDEYPIKYVLRWDKESECFKRTVASENLRVISMELDNSSKISVDKKEEPVNFKDIKYGDAFSTIDGDKFLIKSAQDRAVVFFDVNQKSVGDIIKFSESDPVRQCEARLSFHA